MTAGQSSRYSFQKIVEIGMAVGGSNAALLFSVIVSML